MFKHKTRSAEVDYSAAMLPHTRREVFFDVLKLNWRGFIAYGLLFLIFSLPLHASAIFEKLTAMALVANYDTLTEIEQESVLGQLYAMKNIRAAIDIVSYLVLSVGISGFIRVIRQYAWGEVVSFGSDFATGVRQNIRHMLPIGILMGVLNLLTVYLYNISSVTENKAIALMTMLFAFILLIVSIPIIAYSIVGISIYDKKLSLHFLTSLAMIARAPFKTAVTLILCLLPSALQLIPSFYGYLLGRLSGSMLMPLVLLVWLLFCLEQFDEFVNKKHFPELVGKGLFLTENTDEADKAN